VAQQAGNAQEKSTQIVVVAKEPINERAVIRPGDIRTEERPVEQVPSGAIFKTDDAVGRITTRPILPDQVLLAQHLVVSFPSAGQEPVNVITGTVNFNQALGDNLVAYALPASDRLSVEGILLAGDRIDLLFSTDVVGAQEGTGGKVSIYAIQDLEILQIIYQPAPEDENSQKPAGEAAAETAQRVPKTIILAINPQDSVVLKYALDSQAVIDLALRASDNRRVFDVEAVTINTIADRYQFIAPRPVR
jgi:Flp pilus assembly protein CpaB